MNQESNRVDLMLSEMRDLIKRVKSTSLKSSELTRMRTRLTALQSQLKTLGTRHSLIYTKVHLNGEIIGMYFTGVTVDEANALARLHFMKNPGITLVDSKEIQVGKGFKTGNTKM